MLTIKELYKNAIEQEEKLLVNKKNNPNYSDVDLSRALKSKNFTKFLYSFFEEKNIVRSKQLLFTVGKCDEFRVKNTEKKISPNMGIGILLSDSIELINSFKDWQFENHNYWLKQGLLPFVIQEILKDNKEKALELLDVFEKKHKKYALKEQDTAILRAIIKGDKKGVEALLECFLLPKNHKKCNDTLMLHSKLFSLHATGYAKLAWIKGIEVHVDHPLLPMELLPIKPNKEYVIEYDFLKPEYTPNIKTKQEKPKPNAKYRKDIPKNKIEVTKNLIQELIQQNWEAKYSTQELEDNTNIIYAAFTKPQEFDKTNYAFAKLGNYHISYSDKDCIYIESKPFTNMWTSMKNEVDYFFEVVNVCFDIMGIKLVDGEQYNTLKKELEINKNNNTGFLGKLFNN